MKKKNMEIEDLKARIAYLAETKGTPKGLPLCQKLHEEFKTTTQQAFRLAIDKNTFPADKLHKLAEILGISEKDLKSDSQIFCEKMSISIKKLRSYVSEKDNQIISKKGLQNIFNNIQGDWEIYYYAVSDTKINEIETSVLTFSKLDSKEENIICELLQKDKKRELLYEGLCTSYTNSFSYFALRCIENNETIGIMSKTPNKFGDIKGIILCISEHNGYRPASTKFYGKKISKRPKETLRSYTHEEFIKNPEFAKIEAMINNTSPDKNYPNALIMDF